MLKKIYIFLLISTKLTAQTVFSPAEKPVEYHPLHVDEFLKADGHLDESIFSFEVFSSKEVLLEHFPNSTPVQYNWEDIENFKIIE